MAGEGWSTSRRREQLSPVLGSLARVVRPVGAVLAGVLVLVGCASGPIAERLKEFDPAEVQEVRDGYERDGLNYDEGNVLDTLVMERECRQIRSGLAELASGASNQDIADRFDQILVEDNKERQPYMAVYFQGVVDEMRLGDPANIQEYVELNCMNVK